MIKIYKYEIEQTDHQTLTLPRGSKILSIIEQYGKPVIYAIVDTDVVLTDNYEIIIVGTGHEINSILNIMYYVFLGTLSFVEGNLIFHYFYRKGTE